MNTKFKKKQINNKSLVNVSFLWGFSKLNYSIFTFGLISIFIGYIVMAMGEVNSFQSLTLAPIILTIGYLLLIPSALLYKEKEKI